MNIIKIFRAEMSSTDSIDELQTELARLRRSLQRRDRRIAFLKKQLSVARTQHIGELCAAREVIAGLEDMLLVRGPQSGQSSSARIEELESQLAEMTHLAEMLHQRSGT